MAWTVYQVLPRYQGDGVGSPEGVVTPSHIEKLNVMSPRYSQRVFIIIFARIRDMVRTMGEYMCNRLRFKMKRLPVQN